MSVSVSYAFSPTTTIESSQVNQNFTDIVNYINNTACVTGMIVAWSGSVASIPTGWALDTNSRDKFIIGAGNLYNPDASGGEATHTLTEAEMPSHTHIQDAHSHTIRVSTGGGTDTYIDTTNFGAISAADFAGPNAATATNQNTGGGGAHNNLPPYYAYCFIKKS